MGLVAGLTGVDGGALMTPILVLPFGMAPATAVGTDQWCAAITKIVGGTTHGQRGGVDWQVERRLWWGSLPAALGFLVTLTSIGVGALGAVMLLYLCPLPMVPGRLVGTDIVHAVPLPLVAGVGHLAMWNVDLSLLGSVPGVAIGALASGRVSEPMLRNAIAFAIGVVGVKHRDANPGTGLDRGGRLEFLAAAYRP